MAKPLMSPLLLENSNIAKETSEQASQSLIEGSQVNWDSSVSQIV